MFLSSFGEKGVQFSLKQYSFWQIFILLLCLIHTYITLNCIHTSKCGPHITKDLLTLENMLDKNLE